MITGEFVSYLPARQRALPDANTRRMIPRAIGLESHGQDRRIKVPESAAKTNGGSGLYLTIRNPDA